MSCLFFGAKYSGKTFLLDGYNIIYSLHWQHPKRGLGRQRLFQIATIIVKALQAKARLYFDGRDPLDMMASGPVHVIYAGECEADELICQDAKRLGRKACAVTLDRQILRFCKQHRVSTLLPHQWLKLAPPPDEKPPYPSEHEINIWEKIFTHGGQT